jgi:hypothetical protein
MPTFAFDGQTKGGGHENEHCVQSGQCVGALLATSTSPATSAHFVRSNVILRPASSGNALDVYRVVQNFLGLIQDWEGI